MQNPTVSTSVPSTAATDSVFVVVRDFIAQNFYVPDQGVLSGQASLVDGGILDSTGVLELAAFLETRFKIKIDDSEILPANLDSIDRVVQFIARKRATRGE
jgi:acyl carrier protein